MSVVDKSVIMRCYTQKVALFTFTSCTPCIGLCYICFPPPFIMALSVSQSVVMHNKQMLPKQTSGLLTIILHLCAYLYAHTELPDNMSDCQNVTLQQFPRECLHLDGALAGL